jgi:hypothetical protein
MENRWADFQRHVDERRAEEQQVDASRPSASAQIII